MHFSARTITGAGRGRKLSIPTINMVLQDIPDDLKEGIYACRITLPTEHDPLDAVMHYGPRPVFNDSLSCEVHILDKLLPYFPEAVEIETVEYLRAVLDFESADALKTQIAEDIESTRKILN